MAFFVFFLSLSFFPFLLSSFKFYWTKNFRILNSRWHFSFLCIFELYTFQFLFIFINALHQSTAAFIFRTNMRNWRMCIGCNDPRCHGYGLYFFFFFLLHYYYYCIALQWMWLMIIIRCFFFEWKKRISIEFFERRKCEFSMLEPLVLFVCLRNVWLFAYFPLMAHPECRYDLRLDSYTLHIDKFNNFKFFCVFFSGFKYFTRFPIRLIDW